MLRDETHLAGGRTRRIDHQRRLDQRIGLQPRNDITSRVVRADQSDEDATRAERRDIARHVAGAADRNFVALDREHRRRRLR
jgi:hypothetical protein